ncbi:MAG TPA: hypothetical protein P5117_02575 [Spirochaetia bacterium]|nr:hypothetical protein [Spirochaetales bacterium]HRY79117.1 hypothetical protein [Spirochaetia bacterium]HRZ88347.1 hypothetical protein [Spirochaetia bacterium]
MTLILRISNLLSFLRKAEAARTTRVERAAGRAAKNRMSGLRSDAEEFGSRAAADAWQYACNQRAFR